MSTNRVTRLFGAFTKFREATISFVMSVRLSLCPPVPLSLCPSVPLSPCPSVLVSPCPSVPLSPCPSVPLSHSPPVPLSVCPLSLSPSDHTEQQGSHWPGFHEIWYLNIFRKFVKCATEDRISTVCGHYVGAWCVTSRLLFTSTSALSYLHQRIRYLIFETSLYTQISRHITKFRLR
jgi:hypothetical protein